MGETLSANDITRADFSITMRGYDRDEVDSFLRAVADEHRRITEDLSAARRKADRPYQSFGVDVGELLQHAKDSADKLKRRAEEHAEQTMQEAKKQAAALREKAQHDADATRKAAEYDSEQRIKEAERRVRSLMQAEAEARKRLRDARAEINAVLEQMEHAETSLDGQAATQEPAKERPAKSSVEAAAQASPTSDAARASSGDPTAPEPQESPAA
jgi:DivIVA domain-containing protein